jgi:diguanylate cyclase (GGDEF)-like protein
VSLSWQALLVAAAVDPLTGVMRRATLLHRLQREMEAGAGVGVVYLDLVGLKAVNDTHGHAAGDAVLRAAGARLRASVRRGDLVARMGGDEFAVLVSAGGAVETDAVAQRVRAALAAPHCWGELAVRCPASVGWAVADPPAAPQRAERAADLAAALLDRADRAMYADRGTAHVAAPAAGGPVVAHGVGSTWSLADLLTARPEAAVLEARLLQQALVDERARRAVAMFAGLLRELGVAVSLEHCADEGARALAAEMGLDSAGTASETRTEVSHGETRPASA